MLFRLFLTAFLGLIATLTLESIVHPMQAQTTDLQKIEEILEIHYLVPKMKSPYDTIKISNNRAQISVWRDLPPDPDPKRIECQAYQWLLTGRGKKLGQGAAVVFKELPRLQSIELSLVEVAFDVETTNENRGKLKKVSQKKPIIAVQVERDSLLKQRLAKQANLKKLMLKDNDQCLQIGRRLAQRKDFSL